MKREREVLLCLLFFPFLFFCFFLVKTHPKDCFLFSLFFRGEREFFFVANVLSLIEIGVFFSRTLS